MVSLTTSDNEQFTVDRDVAERSVLIKQMLEGTILTDLASCTLLHHRLVSDFDVSLSLSPHYRHWRHRPAYSSSQRFFQCAQEGMHLALIH